MTTAAIQRLAEYPPSPPQPEPTPRPPDGDEVLHPALEESPPGPEPTPEPPDDGS